MSAQISPHSSSVAVDFPHGFEEGAFEPQPSFDFGDAVMGDFTTMHSGPESQQQHYPAAGGESNQFAVNQFSFQQNIGAFNGLHQQSSEIPSVWSNQNEVPSAFNAMSLQQADGLPRRSVTAIEKFGQITPPDDVASDPSPESKGHIRASISSPGRSDKSERARNAAVQRHSKTKKQRTVSLASSKRSSASEDEGEDKKEKYREKNRLAAAKCRAKKKDNIEGIEDRHRNLSAMNSALKKQVQDLRGELTDLRTHALNHQGCNCRIANYNVNQAQRVAMGVDGIGSSMAGYGSFAHGPDCSSVRGSGSLSATSRHRSSASQSQTYTSPSAFAFSNMNVNNDASGQMDIHPDDEADFADYLQAEFGS